jgi:Predicted nucleic acid-binding protein, contains PIN domain
VDTNVLIDVLHADPQYGKASLRTLETLAVQSILVINMIIYAELAAWIESKERLDAFLPEDLFRRESIPPDAAFLAGRAFRRYKEQRGAKRRMLADFLIGAHAAVRGYSLVTRDRGYARYFQVELIDPSRNLP